MEHIFFNHQSDLAAVSDIVFNSMGIDQYSEGESKNVLSGVYFSYSNFGMLIKIELNSYDFEEQYRFMISIKRDFTKSIEINSQTEELFLRLIIRLLNQNSEIQFAIEKDEMLIDISVFE